MDKLENFKELNELVDNLSIKLIEAVINNPNFNEKIKTIKDNTLFEILYLLVKQEKYEHAIIVRDEIILRNLDISKESKYLLFENNINEFLNKML